MLKKMKKLVRDKDVCVLATVTENLWNVRIPGMTHTASGEVLTNGSYVAPYVIESCLWKAAGLAAKAEIGVMGGGSARVRFVTL